MNYNKDSRIFFSNQCKMNIANKAVESILKLISKIHMRIIIIE